MFNKKAGRKTAVLLTSGLLVFTSFFGGMSTVYADNEDKTVVTLGADLNKDQKKKVLELLELTEDDLDDCIVLEITNQDEHDNLDKYLDKDVIGKRALSSIRLDKTEEGSGIDVTTYNINYCTEDMYANALATAGVKDATVLVAGPFSISGTAALVGTVKAYEAMTGETMDAEAMDTANDELVTTAKIGDSIGDKEKAAELIGYVKNEVISADDITDEDILNIIKDASKELEVELNDEDIQMIKDTMQKISKLDLDVESLKEQAKGVYDKLKSIDINIDTEKAEGFFESFANFFINLFNKIKGLFS
ncbi:MAG: DUF1002 domain-containing protein [Lachnospiraceae bacterium]|nr:DUF1002 domain-containing protein [Lachnospiraceae bacterium]